MRYYIIFGTTFIIALLLLFYHPFLAMYNKSITIELNNSETDYNWEYELNGKALKLDSESDNKWTFSTNKNGVSSIDFKYIKDQDSKYTIHYTFRVLMGKIFWLDGKGYGLTDFPYPY